MGYKAETCETSTAAFPHSAGDSVLEQTDSQKKLSRRTNGTIHCEIQLMIIQPQNDFSCFQSVTHIALHSFINFKSFCFIITLRVLLSFQLTATNSSLFAAIDPRNFQVFPTKMYNFNYGRLNFQFYPQNSRKILDFPPQIMYFWKIIFQREEYFQKSKHLQGNSPLASATTPMHQNSQCDVKMQNVNCALLRAAHTQ